MKKNQYHVLGVMSGTSLDGIDLAFIKFDWNEKWKFSINTAATIPYTQEWTQTLRNGIDLPNSQLEKLNRNYTQYLGGIISDFISTHNVTNLDAVCSHGHTIKHQPHLGITLQIGNLPHLAKIIDQKVICDFRVEDVELGGQGAPLVPVGDELLFPQYTYCLNLGGFANVSTKIRGERIAYDICPVNTVLNHYSLQLGKEYDGNGNFALSGNLKNDLLIELDSLAFYSEKAPKSLGIEWVLKNIFPIIDSYQIPAEDKLRTFCIHIAQQIAACFSEEKGEILVTGGGAYNSFLIGEINSRTRLNLVVPENNLINFKEALIFGFLGVLKLRGENNVLSSVTGASRDHSSGKIYLP